MAPYHVHWRSITTYTATYKAGKRGKGKQTIIVRTIHNPPAELKQFQLAGDALKWFKRVKLTKSKRKAIVIMATKTKKKTSDSKGTKKREKPVEDDTLEELDGLEEVDGLDDEEDTSTTDEDSTDDDDEDSDDEDSDDDTDDDEEEVAPPKSKKKGKKGKKTTRAKANGKIGTQEIAAEAGVDARTLRMVLRKHTVAKDEETGRYEWDSLDAKPVKQILKWIAEGEAKDIKKESLDKLKEKKAAEKAEGKGKKGKKDKKKKKKAEESDDDE